MEFLSKVRKNFLVLPKILRDEKIVIVDGNQTTEKAFNEVKKIAKIKYNPKTN